VRSVHVERLECFAPGAPFVRCIDTLKALSLRRSGIEVAPFLETLELRRLYLKLLDVSRSAATVPFSTTISLPPSVDRLAADEAAFAADAFRGLLPALSHAPDGWGSCLDRRLNESLERSQSRRSRYRTFSTTRSAARSISDS
jgi:hypothetical protein